ncbi:MAG: CRISPR-associated CARF protein Csx1 [Thermoproteota archaeon]|jgi:CRISPR-associated protein Csx1
MNSVLISPWGNPEQWKEVTYTFNDAKKLSRSTLSLLYDALKPERVVIIVLDTLAREPSQSYDDVVNEVKRKCNDFVKEKLKIDINYDVIVAPGVGGFDLLFEGSMSDFYFYILFKLSKILVELDDCSIVHLDLTHGINYMPTLVYRALNEILGVLAYTKRIKFVVYNSEPYREGIGGCRIHVIEKRERIQPRLSAHPLGITGGCNLLSVTKKDEDLSKSVSGVSKVSSEELKELNAFLSSIVNGLPLAVFTFYPSESRLLERLENVVNTWKQNIVCDGKSIRRKLKFTDDFMRYVRLWLASRSMKLNKKEEVSLTEIKDINEKLFKHYGLTNRLISRTIGKLEKTLRNVNQFNEWKKLGEVLEGHVGNFDPQNFLAHAGLEYNVTEIRYKDNVLLRYEKEKINDIINACKEGLFKDSR